MKNRQHGMLAVLKMQHGFAQLLGVSPVEACTVWLSPLQRAISSALS
jgi:hypothetical protein